MLAASLVVVPVLGALTVREPPSPMLEKITIGTSDFAQQSLPLSYVSKWPLWIAAPDGSEVTLLPTEGDEGGWVNPMGFEQIWRPADLPVPASRAAVGIVIKDGTPRYLFPCVEQSVIVSDALGGALGGGMIYHNRGLNSVPLAKTWMIFDPFDFQDLRISCFRAPLPPAEEEDGDDDAESKKDADAAVVAASTEWSPVLPPTEVGAAVDAMFRVLGDAPDEMGKGFQYLIIPLASAPLPPEAVKAGERVRLFLSDIASGDNLDPEDREGLLWKRGECDVGSYDVASGGESDFLPDAYKPLFGR